MSISSIDARAARRSALSADTDRDAAVVEDDCLL
jgi:hypothetical protein